jgi:hypothetical protein
MSNPFKTVRNFKAAENVDNIIKEWAEKSMFKEAKLPTRFFLNFDDIAYCYKLAGKISTTYLMIDILDNMIHLEAFAVKNVRSEKIVKNEIDSLLDILG